MENKPNNPNSWIARVFMVFFWTLGSIGLSNAQTLGAPEPASNPNIGGSSPWTAICASEGFTEFYAEFSWTPPLVDPSNIFILELSDGSGDFSSPIELDRVSNQNTVFDITFEFDVPTSLAGENYKMRVRSTQPELTSPESAAFSMYYLGFDDPIRISPDGSGTIPPGGNLSICQGQSVTLEPHNIDSPDDFTYTWYRSGTVLSEKSASLTVNEAAMYMVEIDYGPNCSGSGNTLSNIIDLTVNTPEGIAINTPSNTELCADDSVELQANSSGTGYTYTWYRGDDIVAGPTVDLATYTVMASQSNFEGNYSVEISGTAPCTERSEAVEISSAAEFTVSTETDTEQLLILGQSNTLTVSTTANSPSLQWFRNGTEISGATDATYQATEAGEYSLRVTETGGSCGTVVKNSETFTVMEASRYEIEIEHQSVYTACEQESTTLAVSRIDAIDDSDNRIDVTSTLIDEFDYQWIKDNANVANAGTNNTLPLDSPTDNGNYTLEASFEGETIESNELAVSLRPDSLPEISSNGTQFCDGANLELSIDDSLGSSDFEWMRNGTATGSTSNTLALDQTGTYQLSVNVEGCTVMSNEIVITNFDDSAVSVSPSNSVLFVEGGSTTVTATGGSEYEWVDQNNNVVSNSADLSISQEGTYMVTVTIDNCQVTRQVTASIRDAFAVPNVITPNGDGFNDQWTLPNSFSGQEDVTVVIYNEQGDELLNETDYQNNWPSSTVPFSATNELFYFKIRRGGETLKQGTLTVIR